MSRAVKEQETTLGAWGDDFTLVLRPSGVGVLSMNSRGGVNALSSPVIAHFGQALDFVRSEPSIKALVIASDKKDMFVAGADIREILRTTDAAVALDLTVRGQVVLTKLLEMPIPTVAAVDGICLGAGLEMIICCDKRIASSNPNTLIGLPEVNIGLIPGLGGTQRLPRLIGLKDSLELIISGEPVSVEEAHRSGIIDQITDKDSLIDEAANLALTMVREKFDRNKYRAEREARAEEADGGLSKRQMMLKVSDRAVRVRTRGLYQVPRKAIEAIERGLVEGLELGLKNEAAIFADMAVSTMAKNMINLYISKEMAVQIAKRARTELGDVTTIGVIGSGQMGMEIAEIAIKNHVNVVLKGSSEEKAQDAVNTLRKKTERLSSPDEKEVVIEAAADNDDLRPAQLVIEAIYEDVDLKNKVLFEISRAVSANCIIASNTSSFAVSNLSQFSDKPERVIGMHFFNPVDRMPLVEVVTHARTNQESIQKAMALLDQMGKVPVVVKDSPGFLVNRILSMFLTDSARMTTESIPMNWIEDVTINFGMPLGAFTLVDELGLELCNKVTRLMFDKFGQRFQPPDLLNGILPYGNDGKKMLKGMLLWDESGRRLGYNREMLDKIPGVVFSDDKPDEATATLIRDRLFLPMIDEAARCLEDKIVRKARDIDLALVMGIAFPRFRGGLLRYADDLGIDYVYEKLTEIYTKYEPAREISGFLTSLHKEGRRFYGLGQS